MKNTSPVVERERAAPGTAGVLDVLFVGHDRGQLTLIFSDVVGGPLGDPFLRRQQR